MSLEINDFCGDDVAEELVALGVDVVGLVGGLALLAGVEGLLDFLVDCSSALDFVSRGDFEQEGWLDFGVTLEDGTTVLLPDFDEEETLLSCLFGVTESEALLDFGVIAGDAVFGFGVVELLLGVLPLIGTTGVEVSILSSVLTEVVEDEVA